MPLVTREYKWKLQRNAKSLFSPAPTEDWQEPLLAGVWVWRTLDTADHGAKAIWKTAYIVYQGWCLYPVTKQF